MQFVVSLTLVAVVIAIWAKLCVHLGRWHAARAGRELGQEPTRQTGRGAGRERRGQRSYLSMPVGHRPPPGLGPLSPSERFLTQEAARGLRELERFLVDQQAA